MIIITSDRKLLYCIHNYFLIEHIYSQFVIYNFKSELKIWINYDVVKIIILIIVIAGIIIQ